MDMNNDPRFLQDSVVSKRLAAFQTICVVAILMVNLSVKQMFKLKKEIDLHTFDGVVQYIGFVLMTMVFVLDIAAVAILIQQLFMTYRLLTVGPTGFEIAKSFYMNRNIVAMRHGAAKVFFYSLPIFLASSSAMVYAHFAQSGQPMLAIPVCSLLLICSIVLWWINQKHASIFKERYNYAKAHEEPLLSHIEDMSKRTRQVWPMNLDV